ncbi:hypothetical protein [Streptomyces sp. NPDC090026]|uniref:hypothetical protein n=1 Tax=Streptomyces sp. NPDC090026 TaxID=3365923 RepID=UPI0037F86A10
MPHCEICGADLVQGRGPARRTCSPACRQKAHRRRQAAEVGRLRDLAAGPAPAAEPPAERAATDLPEPLRGLWLDLAEAVDWAARRVRAGWDSAEVAPGASPAAPDDIAWAIRHRANKLAEAVAASSPQSEPEGATVLVSEPASIETPSRDEPAEGAPAAELVSAGSDAGASRDAPKPARRKRLSAKRAREVAEGATLISDDKEQHTYKVVAADGTLLGRVAPMYKTGRRSGWQGWAADLNRPSQASQRGHATRDRAAVDALGQWIRIVTAKPNR